MSLTGTGTSSSRNMPERTGSVGPAGLAGSRMGSRADRRDRLAHGIPFGLYTVIGIAPKPPICDFRAELRSVAAVWRAACRRCRAGGDLVILDAGCAGYGDRSGQPAVDTQRHATAERDDVRPGDHPVEQLGLHVELLPPLPAEVECRLAGQDDGLYGPTAGTRRPCARRRAAPQLHRPPRPRSA